MTDDPLEIAPSPIPTTITKAEGLVDWLVPVQALIDYIEGGHSLEKFLDDFPTVSRSIAVATLEQAKVHLLADARTA